LGLIKKKVQKKKHKKLDRKIQCMVMLTESDIIYLNSKKSQSEQSRSAVVRKLIRDDKER